MVIFQKINPTYIDVLRDSTIVRCRQIWNVLDGNWCNSWIFGNILLICQKFWNFISFNFTTFNYHYFVFSVLCLRRINPTYNYIGALLEILRSLSVDKFEISWMETMEIGAIVFVSRNIRSQMQEQTVLPDLLDLLDLCQARRQKGYTIRKWLASRTLDTPLELPPTTPFTLCFPFFSCFSSYRNLSLRESPCESRMLPAAIFISTSTFRLQLTA